VNGREIDGDYLSCWVSERKALILDLSLTFFEATTALAFSYFRDMSVTFAVCEVGLGGRLDATNLLSPCCTVITHVDIDHQAQLGSSKGDIAREKLGIVKTGVPIATGEDDPSLLAIHRETARRNGSDLHVLDERVEILREAYDLTGTMFSYRSPRMELEKLKILPLGMHQVRNAALAAMTLEVMADASPASTESIRRGLSRTVIPARLQIIDTEFGMVILDVAHNPGAARALRDALLTLLPGRRAVVVIGMSADKDSGSILQALAPVAAQFIVSKPDFARHERRALPADLLETARRVHDMVSEAADISTAVACGLDAVGENSYLLVTGSFYTVSEALSFLDGSPPAGDRTRRTP
jgi:dihydrofolate synthase/folylpolyglutamate synthase